MAGLHRRSGASIIALFSAAEIATDRDTPITAGPTPPVIAQTTPPQSAVVRSLAQIDEQFSEAVTGVNASEICSSSNT